MSISVRARFILISVSIALLVLILFTSVLHKRVIKYKHVLEIQKHHLYAEQLFRRLSDLKNLNKIEEELAKINVDKSRAVQIYSVLDKNSNEILTFGKNDFNKTIFKEILSEVKKDFKTEGQIKTGENLNFWLIKNLPKHESNQNKLLIVYLLSAPSFAEFVEFFGLPFLISAILLCWIMVWASIILSSLVLKLQNQKQALSDQAIVVAQARDDAMTTNSAKSNFLANMSHEIRTPLTSIIGFAESCLDVDQSLTERSKATKTIIKSSRHLLHIINEILDFSKVEAGKLEIEAMPVSMMETLDEINQLVSIMAEEKGLIFKINYTYPLPEKIISDPLRIKQILINLCSNAIKFTQQGYVHLNVAYLTESSSLIFEVIDTGIGMSAEQLEKIFKPFEQADSSTTRNFGGSGLGLTLSKQLVEMLNGDISVISTVNKGSCFTVKLEVGEAENSRYHHENTYKNSVEKAKELIAEIPKLNGKVLLAEDNEDIRELVKLLMKKVGVELVIVTNGQQAVNEVLNSEYDLVLLDIQMPVMDGLTAMKELKQQGYRKPVIAMTANAMTKDREVYNEAGFSNFISKPINRDYLYLLLSQYLKPMKKYEREKIVLTSNLLINEPDLIDLIDKFMARLPIMKDAINKAYSEGNIEELSGLIHQMKGVGGGYGYPMLTELSAKVEIQIAEKEQENIKILIDEFNSMVEEILDGNDENHKIAEQAQS